MARVFYSLDRLGMPLDLVREVSFVLPQHESHRWRSRLPQLLIFLTGGCHVKVNANFDHLIGQGDLVIFPTPCYHHFRLEKGFPRRQHAFSIYFDARVLSPAAIRSAKPGPARELMEITRNLLSEWRYVPRFLTPSISNLITTLRQEYDEALPGWQVRLQAITNSLLVEIWRTISLQTRPEVGRNRNRSYVVNEVKELLAKSRTSSLTLAQIAWHVRWSAEHLARVFKKETGETVMNHLRNLRIDEARMLLLQSPDTVSSISAGLGFPNAASFCRAFKQVVGQTPSQYRENHPGAHPNGRALDQLPSGKIK